MPTAEPPIPASLSWLGATKAGTKWLNALPARVGQAAARWELELGMPYQDSYVSLVVPAERHGEALALKIQFPGRESEHEAAALQDWDGNGAIRLVEHDPDSRALLLERCIPGDHLSRAGVDTALGVMIGLLPRLWIPVGDPYGSLATEVERWVENLPAEYEDAGEPFDRILLAEALAVLPGLAASQGEQVLVHQDLHGDNVLRADREPWLAIDPKPLRGEREFGLSPIIRSPELGHSAEAVTHRLDRLTRELGLNRERSRLWAFGHAVAWGFEGGEILTRHVEIARWLLDA
ncbi:MAG: aminoglycoside phosphotransferase family protein [Acidimicrobiia bacterium]|nr:aminoglycoside phosphotransferase family protein [Acidimicrobiia bacterium]